MEDKWLVFRLERDYIGQSTSITEPCFELIKEFQEYYAAVEWAEAYTRDHGLRTVVIRGFVFGN